MRIASMQILSVLDGWESIDVSTLDFEDVFRRFVNKRSKDFTPQSMEAYKSRFKQSLGMFLEYTKDPAGWRPAKGRSSSPNKDKKAPVKSVQEHGSRRKDLDHPILRIRI
ncbi:MAG: hypothetical protein ICV83_03165 [Cytophagales bacterium]|nr:hypothetical protein [Cytophagales bacterium]